MKSFGLHLILHHVLIALTLLIPIGAQPNPDHAVIATPRYTGPWSKVLIDGWISAGYHPTTDPLPDQLGSLRQHVVFCHGPDSELVTYCDESYQEYQKELEMMAKFRDDFTDLLQVDDLNATFGHRKNTLLHLYCRCFAIYVIPIQWLYRFGADADKANAVGITPRDFLRDKDLESLLE
jgi:hypothetical protein